MYALIDGDLALFRACFAAERRVHYLKVGENTQEFEFKREADDALDKALPGVYSRK